MANGNGGWVGPLVGGLIGLAVVEAVLRPRRRYSRRKGRYTQQRPYGLWDW